MNENFKSQQDSGVIYAKTDKGTEEIQTRKYKLPQKLRSLLIVIDGKTPTDKILNMFSAMDKPSASSNELDLLGELSAMQINSGTEGVSASLEELERQGFIARRKA